MSDNIVEKTAAEKAEVELVAETYNESTGLSWLWALLFGPLYFWANGFVGRGFFVLLLNFVIIGFFVAPFLAYPAWKKRARLRAEKMVAINRATRPT